MSPLSLHLPFWCKSSNWRASKGQVEEHNFREIKHCSDNWNLLWVFRTAGGFSKRFSPILFLSQNIKNSDFFCVTKFWIILICFCNKSFLFRCSFQVCVCVSFRHEIYFRPLTKEICHLWFCRVFLLQFQVFLVFSKLSRPPPPQTGRESERCHDQKSKISFSQWKHYNAGTIRTV